MSEKCVEQVGRELREHNDNIVKVLCDLQEQRDELILLIENQYKERRDVELQIEKLTYKLCLVNKGLSTRLRLKADYDKALEEVEVQYRRLVANSSELRNLVEQQHTKLDHLINKQTSTEQQNESFHSGDSLLSRGDGSMEITPPKSCTCERQCETRKKNTRTSDQSLPSNNKTHATRTSPISITPQTSLPTNDPSDNRSENSSTAEVRQKITSFNDNELSSLSQNTEDTKSTI